MSYCINPDCSDRCNPNSLKYCQSCGSSLIIQGRYRITKPLRQLDRQHHTEVFEVEDGGRAKILKVLTSDRSRLVELFKQESEILAQLPSLSVAQLDNYFTFSPHQRDKKLHCLVMEKVEGENLGQWLQTHGKLTETLAIDWLKQLLAILVQVHQRHILHRDIKPSNIMIRPDGKLILIDFGTARKLTKTYIEKLKEADITRIYSPGYTPPEQLQGEAVYRSDIFALGRTLVHLITGIAPYELPKTANKQLIWHEQAPQISPQFKQLIDRLIAVSPDERPSELEIFQQLHPPNTNRLVRQQWQTNMALILVASLAIASLILGIRFLGWLEPLELQAFDHLMQLRPLENPDSRILLITVDEADIQYQNQQQMSLRWSLADEALAQLLAKIKPYQPRTIGIDLYRDFAVDADFPNLAKELQTSDRLFSLCKVPAPQDGVSSGTPPPPEVPGDRIGFSDFVADRGDLVRRQLLHITPQTASRCTAEYAFNLQLALHYLSQEGRESSVTEQGYLQINQRIFQPINKSSGGYQNIDAAGYQILLNYRSLQSPRDIAQQISLRKILSNYPGNSHNQQLEKLIKDRLVIIGVTAASSADDWQTPYGDDTAGIFIQAQMTSQIISAVLDHRPLLWWWSNFWEIIWIVGWSFWGGIIGWYLRHPLWLGMIIVLSSGFLFLSCWAIFIYAGWIPLIPSILTFLIASLVTVFLKTSKLPIISKNPRLNQAL